MADPLQFGPLPSFEVLTFIVPLTTHSACSACEPSARRIAARASLVAVPDTPPEIPDTNTSPAAFVARETAGDGTLTAEFRGGVTATHGTPAWKTLY